MSSIIMPNAIIRGSATSCCFRVERTSAATVLFNAASDCAASCVIIIRRRAEILDRHLRHHHGISQIRPAVTCSPWQLTRMKNADRNALRCGVAPWAIMTANSRISSARNAVGTEVVLRAIPDGYTLLMVDASPSINVTL